MANLDLFRRCRHEHTRCIHGDEILARMKVYTLRFWREPVIHRQSCLDCGRALDCGLPDICTFTGTPHFTSTKGTD